MSLVQTDETAIIHVLANNSQASLFAFRIKWLPIGCRLSCIIPPDWLISFSATYASYLYELRTKVLWIALTNFLTNFVTFCSYELSYEKFYEFRPWFVKSALLCVTYALVREVSITVRDVCPGSWSQHYVAWRMPWFVKSALLCVTYALVREVSITVREVWCSLLERILW